MGPLFIWFKGKKSCHEPNIQLNVGLFCLGFVACYQSRELVRDYEAIDENGVFVVTNWCVAVYVPREPVRGSLYTELQTRS